MKRLFQWLLPMLLILLSVPALARDRDKEREAIKQSFGRVGFLGATTREGSTVLAPHLTVDVLGDSRLVLPSGFLFSFQGGMSHRGWVKQDCRLQTSSILAALRPGGSLRVSGNKVRLDLMGGVFASYDLWGSQEYETYSIPLRRIDGYKRFDFGLNGGVSFVIWKFEIYTEFRQGLIDIYSESDLRETSFVWSVGIGWSF